MEVMEDGNLMDKVNILIQRDMEYYRSKQSVLQERICPGIVGGRLDFPRFVSFASMKLVLWWEEEYIAAYRKHSGFSSNTIQMEGNNDMESSGGGCGGIVKASDPMKFANLISKSAEQFLEHLHVLTQEALDHADLSVLTGTIGAASLLKNCLWYYIQFTGDTKAAQTEQIQSCVKEYQEMVEALAERLLDLHCRLLSLYILQDPESLDWENIKPFCESERGSYVIQMWWLYMQGTKEDLWNTVPPKMAQRVVSGMLNESLTILTIRYIQATPSEVRSQLLVTDITNLLMCVAEILPNICDSAEDYLGFSLKEKSKIIRDIHAKCQELFYCLILRGAPLETLFKIFQRGTENAQILQSMENGPITWSAFAFPNVFTNLPINKVAKIENLSNENIIKLELQVLLAQPQPNWSLLLKVLALKNCKIIRLILAKSFEHFKTEIKAEPNDPFSCDNFLCSIDGICQGDNFPKNISNQNYCYSLIYACSEVLLTIGDVKNFENVLFPLITKDKEWAKCFDRKNVWNQIRPPWYESILNLVRPMLPFIVKTTIKAFQTEASIYQTMSIVLALFSHLWDGVNSLLSKLCVLIQDNIPSDVCPVARSVLLQVLVSALYSDFLMIGNSPTKKQGVRFDNKPSDSGTSAMSDGPVALIIAEALCSIDEDNKHTDQIEEFLKQVEESYDEFDINKGGSERVGKNVNLDETIVSDLLMTSHGKKSLKKLYNFLQNYGDWVLTELDTNTNVHNSKELIASSSNSLLYTMFHVGNQPFDQYLSGPCSLQWAYFLSLPMGLTTDRIWGLISQRWQFRDINSKSLKPHDIYIINTLTNMLKPN